MTGLQNHININSVDQRGFKTKTTCLYYPEGLPNRKSYLKPLSPQDRFNTDVE
jgi:hypothetical protein